MVKYLNDELILLSEQLEMAIVAILYIVSFNSTVANQQ